MAGSSSGNPVTDRLVRELMIQHCMPDPPPPLSVLTSMVISFGFITFFANSFTLAPIFAFGANVLALRQEVVNMVCVNKRSLSDDNPDLTIWMELLDAIAFLGVVVNCSIFFFTSSAWIDTIHAEMGLLFQPIFETEFSKNLTLAFMRCNISVHNWTYEGLHPERLKPQDVRCLREDAVMHEISRVDQLLILLVTEHVLVMIKVLIAWAVPDVPEWIELRNNYNRSEGLQQQVSRKIRENAAAAEQAAREAADKADEAEQAGLPIPQAPPK